ncbi:hypothetical protein PR048_020117 [Dryococelus australis]|uniref:Endonuclease/exonuclease/phosphatase domain-containing protein n=1 Tax=Dryococelus australis TaxID=614101 RepID=A0ABQ9H5D9_9NEOP|nr:hypothetical protein PR048_020117 [Dryococelus australis]
MGSLNNDSNTKSHSFSEITIATWNANGLKPKEYEFASFLYKEKIDIALVTETKLAPNTRISLPDFKINRADKMNYIKGGGTAIVIKKNIPHLPIGSNYENTEIKIPSDIGDITIAALYSPPNYKNLTEDLQDNILQGPNYIIGGILTANFWHGNGIRIHNLADNYKFSVEVPGEPTYYPYNMKFKPGI